MDLSNVFKLDKGPEHGHVNCLFFLQKISGAAVINITLRKFKKCPDCPDS